MRPSTFTPLLLLLTLSPLTVSLGINCRGSSYCDPNFSFRHPYPFIPTFAALLTNGTSPPNKPLTGGPLPPTRILYPLSPTLPHIACDTIPHAGGGFCVFLQGNVPETGVSGEVVRERMEDLVRHGCQECGSVPLSGDNNPHREGILTVNWVSWTDGCDGLCTVAETAGGGRPRRWGVVV